MGERPERVPRALPWKAGALLLVLHATLYAGWLVDDAGISFAYAKNLAAGLGPVPQPGAAPVEGYSNPLWVALMVPFYALGLTAAWVPKLLSVALLLLALRLLAELAAAAAPRAPEATVRAVTVLTALNPSVVLWGTSGLENPLYLVLFLALGVAALRVRDRPTEAPWLGLGLLAGALSLTRPEGLLLALAPALWLALPGEQRQLPDKRYLQALFGLFGAHLLMRVLIFGDLVPNTFHAKATDGMAGYLRAVTLSRGKLGQLWDLGQWAAGPEAATLVLLLAAGAVARSMLSPKAPPALRLGAAWLTMATGAYLLLPPDWMGEGRFATCVFPVLYLVLLAGWGSVGRRPRVTALAITLGILAAPSFRFRAVRKHISPTIPLDYVRRVYVEGVARWAGWLGLERASFLLPDIGAFLLESPHEAVDLAGLTDTRIARLLHGPRAALREHVLADRKPDFIHVNPAWAPELAFGEDPRFARDYVSFYRYPPLDEFPHENNPSGYFVRREHVTNRPEVLARLRAEKLSWEELIPPKPRGVRVLALALMPLPLRGGWLPEEPPGPQGPGRRHRRGFGEIQIRAP